MVRHMLTALVAVGVLCGFAGCPKNYELEIQADLWKAERIADVSRPCDFGHYRKVACRKGIKSCENGAKYYEEFISYCAKTIETHIAIHVDDYAKHLAEFQKFADRLNQCEARR